jgi:hypothetical protein
MAANEGSAPLWAESHNELQNTIDRLRLRAERCRDLSCGAASASIAAEFENLAQDYESDAQRLEARSSAVRRATPQGT